MLFIDLGCCIVVVAYDFSEYQEWWLLHSFLLEVTYISSWESIYFIELIMQTKKKLPARNAAREHATSRSCRQQRKVSERGQIADKKVTDLITSSARKQRFGTSFDQLLMIVSNVICVIVLVLIYLFIDWSTVQERPCVLCMPLKLVQPKLDCSSNWLLI